MYSPYVAFPSTMDREEDATRDPSLSPPSAAPPSAPAPLPSASTKRRWSPCTWRYAIEEAQADLPSRSRSTTTIAASAGLHSSSRPPSQHQQQHGQAIKAKPPNSHHNPSFCKSAESAPQRSSHHVQPLPGYPPSESHMRPPSAHTSLKSRIIAEPTKKSLQHELLCTKARVSGTEEEEKEGDAEQDDGSEDGEDADGGVVRFDEEYFKRRRREMSPSELYFCAECSATARVRSKPLNDQS
ncbi:hypothetical protein GOP47_0019272 [Adiantum capillus-veneris]|uniref:Uncharacterized protein n=1 Tax=Adiantum capillus-veneris TaxID=13818 RepID=A0A9D4UFQ4_ADICA|nr:hypothetical protein GOP47_0019272 [Adiantum capillus-veneris]